MVKSTILKGNQNKSTHNFHFRHCPIKVKKDEDIYDNHRLLTIGHFCMQGNY
jgi:hypothetical protein